MDKEKALLLSAIAEHKSALEVSLNKVLKSPKSAEASIKARKEGNALFLDQNNHDATRHELIFHRYCDSIASAPMESVELAFAFGNRSYFLLHIHKYEDCIKDIDQALKIKTVCQVLKAKLLCRKAECLKRLGFSDFSKILDIAQSYINKIDGNNREKLIIMINKVKTLIVTTKGSNVQKEKSNAVPITKDYSSCVSIQYNERYGRHLTAKKDYKPGDIIYVEKIYASGMIDKFTMYCQYCLQSVWSSIPCKYCDWAMFCSENCREKAWNNYHETECSLISYLKETCDEWNYFIITIRAWITGINEAGSIANLIQKLEAVDKCTDIRTKGYFENGRFLINSIQNIYALTTDVDCWVFGMTVPIVVPEMLILLIRNSKLCDGLNIKTIEDLTKNEDIISLGALLIRIMLVASKNGFCFNPISETGENIPKSNDRLNRDLLTTLSSLINHSCFPTAGWCYTEQNTFLLYAWQPIKKDSQIFITYNEQFYAQHLSIRRESVSKYNFECTCEACNGAWEPLLLLMGQQGHKSKGDLNDARKLSAVQETVKIACRIRVEGKAKMTDIKKLSSLIVKAKDWKQPSLSYCLLLDALKMVVGNIYCSKSPSFNRCN